MAEIIADNGEVCFLRFNPPDFTDFFNGFGVTDITSHTINSIRWVDYDATLFQDINNLLNKFFIWIVRIDLNQHIEIQNFADLVPAYKIACYMALSKYLRTLHFLEFLGKE
jgi:hypothetical protein